MNPTICKMIGLNKLGANDVAYGTKPQQTAVYEFANADGIKNVINSLLFDHRMDSVLVNYNNQLFVCEVTDMNEKRYAKKVLTYHPLGDKVSL
jgi:hypothetical protein